MTGFTVFTSGTGVGVNLSAVTPSNADNELNAQIQNAKNALAMIADSLKTADVSFVERRPHEYDNHTNRPAVTHPQHTIRVPVGEREGAHPEPWEEEYENLVEQFPEEVKEWFREQFKSSYYSRDLEFYALHALLATVAEGVVWLKQAQQPSPPTSPVFQRTQENLEAPFAAVQAAIVQGREVLQKDREMWQMIGPNDPYFDKNLNTLNQTEELLQALEEVITSLASDPTSKEAKTTLSELSKAMKLIEEEYWTTSAGQELQNLGYTLHTLSMAISTLLLGYGKASALWPLALSNLNLNSTIQTAAKQLAEGLGASLNEGEKQVFSHALATTLTVTLGTALGISERGLPYLPQLEPGNDKLLRELTLILSAKMVSGTNLLSNIYGGIAKEVSNDPQTQEAIKNSATLLNLVLITMALEGKEGHSEVLFNTWRGDMATLINKMSEATLQPLKIYMNQAKIALENSHYDGFRKAFHGLTDALNLSSKQMQSEFEEIKQTGYLVREAVRKGPDESANRMTAIQAI